MYYLEITLKKDCLTIFPFLRDYPTKAYQKGDYFKLLYFKPTDHFLIGFDSTGIRIGISNTPNLAGWHLIRDLEPILATGELLEVIEDLEISYLANHRMACYLQIKAYIGHLLGYGIRSRYDMQYFTKLLFVHGYDQETVIQIFSNLTKNIKLSKEFVLLQSKLYQAQKGKHEY
ncbi:TPA: hypothetical protein ACJ66A_001699 [Streptococcus pyogenes]|uniref:hypothetical protein n=1 Tax=Streptococcus pyogenes TaxID=1314 RepID=UPI000DA414A6|nr:hypothetical protein [Streptococcus pyogenes]HER4819460.1 hypothetical protein [Streptococcus pyogenes NGAS008]SQG41798.1 phage protein [Streptococcus pyogenes]VGQ22970.1 phage protein [Streptococcus pyogenes]VGQ30042.1 phage protein [Streptococcus pyogenes]VGR25562.1 phage protein [Streptococcus pyogenes]